MKQSDNFSFYLSKFMQQYLPGRRNLSVNTIYSYRDTFVQLITFCNENQHIKPEKLKISSLSRNVVEDFLDSIENERRCSISTRNQRLAAIKSFFHFIQVEEPEHMLQCQAILAIKSKETEESVIVFLTSDEVQLLLGRPDKSTKNGRRDIALLSLLYDSAARVQELCDITMNDLRLESPPVLNLHGKGRKERSVPLSPDCAEILKKYIAENNLNRKGNLDHPLFFNSRGDKLTRSGVSYILGKYMSKLYEDGEIKKKKEVQLQN